METKYSLREFYNQVKELATLVNKTYCTVDVEINSYTEIRFRCYVDSYGYISGKTPDECLQGMRNKMFPIPAVEVIVDTVIDTEVEAMPV